MKRILNLTSSNLLLIIIYACSTSPTESDNKIKLTYSAEDSLEAYNLALWFEGNLLPSKSTVDDLLFSINYLRYVYSDSFPVLIENRFETPWETGKLIVGFDDSTAVLVNNHQYDGWNLLDSSLLPDSILEYPDRLGIALFGFDKEYNPLKLATFYKDLPGVEFSEPNYTTYFEGKHPVFPGLIDSQLSYVFVENYSYFPGRHFYFKYMDGEPIFIGYKLNDNPDWWAEAKKNIDQFYSWLGP